MNTLTEGKTTVEVSSHVVKEPPVTLVITAPKLVLKNAVEFLGRRSSSGDDYDFWTAISVVVRGL